jgi:hypothetical protein
MICTSSRQYLRFKCLSFESIIRIKSPSLKTVTGSKQRDKPRVRNIFQDLTMLMEIIQSSK